MANNIRKILITELSTSHQDSLYSQLRILLHSGNEIHLLINSSLSFEQKYFIDKLTIHKIDKTQSFLRLIKILNKIIKQNNIDIIIFNTAQGLTVRNICLYLLKNKIKCYGVLHEGVKIFKSISQKMISWKIKKYFVLSDSVAEFCRYKSKQGIEFESFYTLFPPFKITNKLKGNEITITIPGEVSDKRKDYTGLINFLTQHKDRLPKNITFNFLGTTKTANSSRILHLIKENKLEKIVHYHSDYIPEEKFFNSIQISDIIMPLIHPDTGSFNEYSSSKISGAFSLAFSYKIPLLMHEYFKGHEDFEEISIFYNENNLLQTLLNISSNPSILKQFVNNYSRKTRFTFEYQSSKYLKFLNI